MIKPRAAERSAALDMTIRQITDLVEGSVVSQREYSATKPEGI